MVPSWPSFHRRSVLFIPAAKEARTVPLGASDGEGHLGEAVISLAVPGKTVGHHHHPLRLPRGRRPSTTALTRSGARKASEMVILTCRTLHFSRAQSSATVVTRPETTSSSHRRPRAMALTRRARRSFQ